MVLSTTAADISASWVVSPTTSEKEPISTNSFSEPGVQCS
jgi:hypothetical protein